MPTDGGLAVMAEEGPGSGLDAGGRVLVVGAAGFIGRQVTRALAARGRPLAVHARRGEQLEPLFPIARRHALDLARAADPASWSPLLAGVEAVVVAAGIMGERRGDTYAAVHEAAARALFTACAAAGVRRVVLISASGVGAAPHPYWASKASAEEHLAELGGKGRLVGWAVIRPSVVVGRGGASDALFRALAALPVAIRLVGDHGRLRPIHVEDLAAAVAELTARPGALTGVFDAAGPEALTLEAIVARYRVSLGLAPARVLPVPAGLLAMLAAIAAALAAPPPMHPEPVRLLALAPATDPEPLAATSGIAPRPLAAALAQDAARGDLPEARMGLLDLLARVSLAALWLGSGLLSLSPFARPSGRALLAEVGITGSGASWLLWLAAGADIAVGLALLRNWRPLLIGGIQLALIGAFTLILTSSAPGWWLHPFGPLLKNLPIAALVLVVMAREGR
jgi:uncharacterized protein YbjT (DUF2867 family)